MLSIALHWLVFAYYIQFQTSCTILVRHFFCYFGLKTGPRKYYKCCNNTALCDLYSIVHPRVLSASGNRIAFINSHVRKGFVKKEA